MTDDDVRSRNRSALLASLTVVGNGDVDQQLQYYTDDFTLEFPYADPPKRVEGKETIRE